MHGIDGGDAMRSSDRACASGGVYQPMFSLGFKFSNKSSGEALRSCFGTLLPLLLGDLPNSSGSSKFFFTMVARSLLLSLLFLALVCAPIYSSAARTSASLEKTKSNTGDLNPNTQQREWLDGAADDWDETELEIDGAGEDFPQERPHTFYDHAHRDVLNRF